MLLPIARTVRFLAGLVVFAAAALSAVAQVPAGWPELPGDAKAGSKEPLKAAIFVQNRAGAGFNAYVPILEDLLSTRMAEAGIQVISREVVINSIKAFPGQGDDLPGAKLDQLLSNNSTALRLSQLMGADYILSASITSFGQEKKHWTGYGVRTVNVVNTLRVSYKLMEAVRGGALLGDTVAVRKTVPANADITVENTDLINGLLDEASTQLTAHVSTAKEAGRIAKVAAKDQMMEFEVIVGMQDMNIPEVRKDEQGNYFITGNAYKLEAMGVTVELDGVVVGTAPGRVQALPGLHKLRLSREGFEDIERTINLYPGQPPLTLAMRMTDAGRQRWLENTRFLEDLKSNTKLTDAQVRLYDGLAQFFRQSGMRVDKKEEKKEDIKVDTKEGIKIQKNQSVFNQAAD